MNPVWCAQSFIGSTGTGAATSVFDSRALGAIHAIPHAVLIGRRGEIIASGDPVEVFAKAGQIGDGLAIEPSSR
jgi:hypothetical protein